MRHIFTPTARPQGAEDALRKETGFFESVSGAGGGGQGSSDVSSVLSVYKSEGDPEAYTSNYVSLKVFVEKSLDIYKVRGRDVMLICALGSIGLPTR